MPPPSAQDSNPLSPKTPASSGASSFVAACLASTLTGGALMILGLVWFRRFETLVGHDHYAANTLLIIVLLGLGFGASLAANRPAILQYPFQSFARLQIALVAWALVVPLLLKALHLALPPLTRLLSSDTLPEIPALVRAFAALLLFALPSILAGAALPTLLHAGTSHPQSFATRFSLLLGCLLLGAGAGAAIGGFILLPRVGLAKSSLFAGLLLLGAALITFIFAQAQATAAAAEKQKKKSKPKKSPSSSPAPNDNKHPSDTDTPLPPHTTAFRCLILAGIAGGLVFFLLTHWLRILPLLLGDNSYIPITGLTVFFFALGGGCILLGWLPDRSPSRNLPGTLISVAFLVAGVSVITSIYRFGDYPEWIIRRLASETAPTPEKLWSQIVSTDFRISLKSLFLPTLCLGAIIPLIAGILGRLQCSAHDQKSPPTAASIASPILLATAIGAACGALSGGLISLPRIGLHLGFFFSGAVAVLASIGAILSLTRHSQLRLTIPLTTIFLVLVWFLFREPWERKNFALGSWIYNSRQADFAGQRYRETLATSDLLLFLEGATSTVAALQGHDNTLYCLADGTLASSSSPTTLSTHRLLGHLGMLLHPGTPAHTLNIGFDTGITAGAISRHPDLESLHTTTLEPATSLVAGKFHRLNHNVLNNDKTHLVSGDGRSSLAASKKTFDLICVSPVHPTRRLASTLLTREFFHLAKSRLAENGILCQAIPAGDLAANDHIALVATFAEVFPDTLCFTAGSDLILVGYRDGLKIDLDRTKKRLRQLDVASSLNELGISNPAHLWGTLIADFTRQQPGLPNPPHTDNAPFVEFNTPKIAFTNTEIANRQLQIKLLTGHGQASSALIEAFSQPEQDEILNQQGALANALHAGVLLSKSDVNGAIEAIEKGLALGPRNPFVLREASSVYRTAGIVALQQREETNATLYFKKAHEAQPHDFQNLRLLTVAYLRAGEQENAAPLLLEGRDRFPNSPHFFSLAGSYHLERGELEQSLAFHALAVSKAPHLDSLWTQYLLAARATASEEVLKKIETERLEYQDN